MQMRKLDAAASREVLNECKTRVDAIALIHEKLYQSQDFTNLPFASYAKGLVSTIMQASGISMERIVVQFAIDDVSLPVDLAIPCGLILNELVTNAIKHAFPQLRRGIILVALRRLDATALQLSVTDDGVGMHDFDVAVERDSIGLSLVASLADQLNGKWGVAGEAGTSVFVDFRMASPQQH
jgi:two-component sensor histidine kinase